MIIAGFTAAVVLALAAVSTSALQSYRISTALRQDLVATTLQHLLADDTLTWLDNGAVSGDAQALRARDQRLTDLANWGTGLTLGAITRTYPPGPFFAKGALLSARPGGNTTHPLEELSGIVSPLGYSLNATDGYLGAAAYSATLQLRETPACDVAFISVGPYQPVVDSIPLTVVGTALFPSGASASAVPGKLTSDRLVSASLPSALSGISAKRHVGAVYRASWGSAPANLVAPTNLAGTAAPQSYFNSADRTIGIQEGGMVGEPVAGVSYRSFPSGGPNRLVITLADLPPSLQRLYVNFEAPDAAANGIVVIGDPSQAAGVTRTIGTNGSVWLWGDNNQPVAIASARGTWTLTDDNWTESSSGSLPALNLAWAGHLFSPLASDFSTPQTGPTARLNLNGSLTSGTVGGNVSAMTITQQAASPLRSLVERIAYLYRFD